MAYPVIGAQTINATTVGRNLITSATQLDARNSIVAARAYDVFAEDKGVGDGSGNDAERLQEALNEASARGGGSVRFRGDMYLASNITIPKGVGIVGDLRIPGGYNFNFVSQKAVLPTKIFLEPGVTIFTNEGSYIVGCFIGKNGVTYPVTAAQAAAWTDTAVTWLNGSGILIQDVFIGGFATAFDADTSNGKARFNFNRVSIDCTTGIKITASNDVDRLTDVHIWPFFSAASGFPAEDIRDGIGIALKTNGSWARLRGCFVYGHSIHYQFENTTHVSMVGCAADGVYNDSIGVNIIGTAKSTKIVNFDCNGSYGRGIVVNTDTDSRNTVQISNSNLVGFQATNHLEIASAGHVSVVGNTFDGGEAGIGITSDSGMYLNVEGNVFADQTVAPTRNASAGYTGNVIKWGKANVIRNSLTSDQFVNAVDATVSVASAATVALPSNSDYILVTGTTTITAFRASFPGRRIVLAIADGLTINQGATIKLLTGANTVFAAGDRPEFYCSGNAWYELSSTSLKPGDIDTLAELNALVSDATLIDTTDSRLSDSRDPNAHTHPESDLATTDVTTGDTSTTKHGLAPKMVAPASGSLNVLGIANSETAATNKTIFEGCSKIVVLTEAAYAALGTKDSTTVYLRY